MIPLEAIVKEAQDAFITAKKDGVLNAGEVIQIALQVAQKLQGHGRDLCGSEKKALVQLTLQKGLKAAGGLPVLAGATPEILAALEAEFLSAAAVAVDSTIAAAHGQMVAFRKSASCFQILASILRPAAAVAKPKDNPLLQEALALVRSAPSGSSIQVSTTPSPEPNSAPAAPVEETSPSTPPEKEPSPQASAEESRTPAPVETSAL